MSRHNQTVFYIEWMQPNWLYKPTQQWLLTKGIGWILGLVFSLGLMGIGYISVGLVWGLYVTITFIWLSYEYLFPDEIVPREAIRLSWAYIREEIAFRFGIGLAFGLIAEISGLIGLSAIPSGSGIIAGAIFSLVLLFGSGEFIALSIRTVPNEGIYRSIRNALFRFLIYTIGFGIASALVFGLARGITLGLVIGIALAIKIGGIASIQHAILRLLLISSGETPWAYVKFLDYAARRVILRKIGGGYIFIHKLVLEYFSAQYEIQKSN